MDKNRKRRLWALLILLLFLPPCYYMHSTFVGRKAQLERERLLVKRGIVKPPPTEERVLEPPVKGIYPPPVHEGEEPEWKPARRMEARKRRPVILLKREAIRAERKPVTLKAERPRPKEKLAKPPTLRECEGVYISHRSAAFFFGRGLNLGSDLSYAQAVMALDGFGISPGAGWNQGDPSFPLGADELGEILSEAGMAISKGLVAADYSQLKVRLRRYCREERAQLVETPRCPGPMVSECEEVEISHCDFAIYVCRVLGIGEDLKCRHAFLALDALEIAPERGWSFDEPYALLTLMEIEEVRCSVREAYKRGLIQKSPTLMVASINDFCLWLKMNIEVVGEGTIAETIALRDYTGEGRIPGGSSVASASE